MEREPKLLIQLSKAISRGEFVMIIGEEKIMGTITDLADSFIAGGLSRREIEGLKDVNLIVNEEDWETCRDLIWTGDVS